jgi:hypothetical protein
VKIEFFSFTASIMQVLILGMQIIRLLLESKNETQKKLKAKTKPKTKPNLKNTKPKNKLKN